MALICDFFRATMQRNHGTSMRGVHNFYVANHNSVRKACSERLYHRLFGSKARRKMRAGKSVFGAICALGFRKHALYKRW